MTVVPFDRNQPVGRLSGIAPEQNTWALLFGRKADAALKSGASTD